ncbi:Ig-like domain-containing protein [Agriterribacter sp.]|uniref:Ig-like domain-containing protein n=1 Tax=Agriterribacter sp. TaxID=2821509 RepID=UPI002C13087D|nr:Ig-like domain-containing protein [Agriterribacter sp.]HTN06002.1 Ig-like domain-containing protein [Agriterribacter sp.]
MKNNNRVFVSLVSMLLLSIVLVVSCKEKFDHTIDTENPVIVSYNPASAVEGVAVNSDLILTFSENVKKGSGEVIIIGTSDTLRINVATDAVTIDKDMRVVTINPPVDLEADEQYTVTLDKGIVTDLLGNAYMGMAAGSAWTFKTVGTSGLALSAINPLPGSTNASLFTLELTFAADVQKGTGNISVFESSGDVKVAEIPVTGQSVTVDGKNVTIRLGTPLTFATGYYVLADAGSIVDADGKAFEGFLTPASWSFTTTSGSGNSLLVYLPMDNDLYDASGNRFDAMQGDKASAKVSFVTDAVRGRVASFVAGSYAVLPKHNLLRPALTQSFSFSFWTKLVAIGSDPVLFGNSDWDSGGNPGFLVAIDGALEYTGPGSPGKGWLLKVTGDAGGVSNRMDWRAGEMIPQAPALADNQWHMVTVVFDQAAKLLHVYIDGKEYTKATPFDLNILKGPLWDSANDYPFTIWEDGTGAYNAGSDTRKALSGFVDDVRIYTKALSAEEISGIYIADQK